MRRLPGLGYDSHGVEDVDTDREDHTRDVLRSADGAAVAPQAETMYLTFGSGGIDATGARHAVRPEMLREPEMRDAIS
jgi:hypothetical protein